VASPLKGLLTDIVALGTSRLVGRTVELTRPNGAIVARVERVALVPSDPVPARMLDPVTWWLDTIDGATTGVGQLFGLGSVPDESAGRIDLLESGELTLRDVTVGGRRIDRVEVAAAEVGAVIGLRQLVRTGPVSLIATLTADDVRTWLPTPADDAGRSLRLRGDGRISIRWKRGWLGGEVAARIEPHAETVDLVADRLVIAGREFVIPSRWRQRRSVSTAPLATIGAELRDVGVDEGLLTVGLTLASWAHQFTYEQLVRLHLQLVDHAQRVVVELIQRRAQ
jgi:hypothetical protein